MTKVHARGVAVKMRKQGYSYSDIAPRAGVSKSTLSIWLANVEYTPNAEVVERIGKARAASSEAKSRIKRESIALALGEAKKELGVISRRDLFMLGLGLYIGEGEKSTQQVRFVNSNPYVMNLAVRWFVKTLGLSRGHLRLHLHLYPDSNEVASLRYWSRMTTIPLGQFRKTMVDRRTNKRAVKAGKLPYGTAHLSVNSLGEKRFGVFLARKIAGWSEMVLETKNAGLVQW